MICRSQKYIKNEFCDDIVVLNPRTKEVCLLNQTAAFILEACDGRSIEELAQSVYDICIDKDNLSLHDIKKDCMEIIKVMVEKDLVKPEEE